MCVCVVVQCDPKYRCPKPGLPTLEASLRPPGPGLSSQLSWSVLCCVTECPYEELRREPGSFWLMVLEAEKSSLRWPHQTRASCCVTTQPTSRGGWHHMVGALGRAGSCARVASLIATCPVPPEPVRSSNPPCKSRPLNTAALGTKPQHRFCSQATAQGNEPTDLGLCQTYAQTAVLGSPLLILPSGLGCPAGVCISKAQRQPALAACRGPKKVVASHGSDLEQEGRECVVPFPF